jgi:hypothetical protein
MYSITFVTEIGFRRDETLSKISDETGETCSRCRQADATTLCNPLHCTAQRRAATDARMRALPMLAGDKAGGIVLNAGALREGGQ